MKCMPASLLVHPPSDYIVSTRVLANSVNAFTSQPAIYMEGTLLESTLTHHTPLQHEPTSCFHQITPSKYHSLLR
jgi:hypothetical protein